MLNANKKKSSTLSPPPSLILLQTLKFDLANSIYIFTIDELCSGVFCMFMFSYCKVESVKLQISVRLHFLAKIILSMQLGNLKASIKT